VYPSVSTVSSSFSSSSITSLNDNALRDGPQSTETWKIASSSSFGKDCLVRSLLVTQSSAGADYSIPAPFESPHLFSPDSIWQIASGDSKGHVTIHRGRGILASPIVAKKRSSISLSSAQGFNSDTVRTMMTQVLGVGGISALCSLGRHVAPRKQCKGLEQKSSLSDRLVAGTSGGFVLAIDVNTGNFLLIYICNFHVLSHLLLIYIRKLYWKGVLCIESRVTLLVACLS
jgi:hypothetical protein